MEVQGDAHRLRRNWIVPAIGALGVLLACIFGRSPVSSSTPFWWFLGWIGMFLTPITLARNAFRFARRTSYRATPEQLELSDRKAPIRVEEIKEAKLVPHPGQHGDSVVELVLANRERVSLWMRRPRAQELLNMLAIRAGERRARFRVVIPFSRRFLATLAFPGIPWFVLLASKDAGSALVVFPLAVVPVLLLLAAVLGMLFKGAVVIGAEGLTVRWIKKRFIPFREVLSINGVAPFYNSGLVDTAIGLQSGQQLRLRAVEAPETEAQRGVEGHALLEHTQDAYRRWQRLPQVADLGAQLERGRRSARDWRQGIDHVVRGGAGYRVASVTEDALVDLLRSDAESDKRIGAAAALIRIGTDRHRAAVRVAASACAEPTVADAMQKLAEAESDAEVEAALEPVVERRLTTEKL